MWRCLSHEPARCRTHRVMSRCMRCRTQEALLLVETATRSLPLPNGMRLSCGAELDCSQTECYHTACRLFSQPVEDGRRQLQARVRQRVSKNYCERLRSISRLRAASSAVSN